MELHFLSSFHGYSIALSSNKWVTYPSSSIKVSLISGLLWGWNEICYKAYGKKWSLCVYTRGQFWDERNTFTLWQNKIGTKTQRPVIFQNFWTQGFFLTLLFIPTSKYNSATNPIFLKRFGNVGLWSFDLKKESWENAKTHWVWRSFSL